MSVIIPLISYISACCFNPGALNSDLCQQAGGNKRFVSACALEEEPWRRRSSRGEMSSDIEARRPVERRRELKVALPTGDEEYVLVDEKITVRDLKQICELKFGIPVNLVTFIIGESELQEWQMLDERSGEVIELRVPVWWRKIVCAALRRELENASRRVRLPMQQITEEERCFVFLFISCCLGDEQMTSRALFLDVKIDSNTRTPAGRTVLHAAAAGGNIQCVDVLIKNWSEFTPELFSAADLEKEIPYDVAKRSGHYAMEMLLFSYTNKGCKSGRWDECCGTLREERQNCLLHLVNISFQTADYIEGTRPQKTPSELGVPRDESLRQNNQLPCDSASSFTVRTPSSHLEEDGSNETPPITAETRTPQQAGRTTRQSLLHRRTGWSHTLPNFDFTEQEEEEEEEEEEEKGEDRLTYLPPVHGSDLVNRRNDVSILRFGWKRAAVRPSSSPGWDTRSAPTSPQPRRAAAGPATKIDTFPLSAPSSPQCHPKGRRSSEPFAPAPFGGHKGISIASHRSSQQSFAFSPTQPWDRRKSR